MKPTLFFAAIGFVLAEVISWLMRGIILALISRGRQSSYCVIRMAHYERLQILAVIAVRG
jgi:hypothetical protein